MSFKFDNYAEHVGVRGKYDWFAWKVFLDEPSEKLMQVKSVEYHLHPTFPEPVRLVEDRASKFELRSAGWGEFLIAITIDLVDGTEEYTEYKLDLSKPWPDYDGSG